MRKVTFGVANSLDNFIARADGSVDWLVWSDEVNDIIAEFWPTIDTIITGRKTYEPALKHGGGSNPYKGMKTYAFSQTLGDDQGAGAEIVRGDAVEFVRGLQGQSGKGICVMGGGELGRARCLKRT